MTEAWMNELLSSLRDAARDNAMHRLAEHLDDALLLVASEYHGAEAMSQELIGHDAEAAATLRGDPQSSLH
jgi:hypothetical protein